MNHFFTARRHASAVYSIVSRVSVCLSVRLSQVGVLLKQLNVESRKQRRTMTNDCRFLERKIWAKLKRSHSQQKRQMHMG